MNSKPNILFVQISQYGKHTDSYKHCQYLVKYYNITYLCFEQNNRKIEDDIDVIYLKDEGSSIRNIFKIIKKARGLIAYNNYILVYIFYFKFCSLIKMFSKNSFLLDIRTGSVNKKIVKRWQYNFVLKVESIFFKNISIISDSLRKKLKIDSSKCTIIPLGADIISTTNKSYKKLSLFYIGSLDDRDIYKTVDGLFKFISKSIDKQIEISYDIFGDGTKEEILRLKESITDNRLENIVKYHGRKEHYEIQNYFDRCNIGVSYVPMTEYYDCQPPTKTFEYINSGMVCLATDTSENRLVINSKNGILFNDNAESFSKALNRLYKNRDQYKTDEILQTLNNYTWKRIFNDNLFPLIKKITKNKKEG